MRLIELDLERYGGFTDRRINFDKDARLHLVHGRNEAGKSTALAAITDLFFGFGPSTPYAFQHPLREMRLGATITAKNHLNLQFRRKYGSRNALLDAQDRPLPDERLAPYLGGLTREVFCRAFGLDASALRTGAETLLASEGDLGESLMAAASGLSNLSALKQRLESEANEIFGPRRSKERLFYQAYDRFEQARKAIGETELKQGDWKKLNADIEDHAQKLSEIRESKRAISQNRARLERLQRAAPILQEIDQLAARLEQFSGLPEVPEGFTQTLATALEKAMENKKSLDDLRGRAREAEEEIESFAFDPALLSEKSAVQKLFAQTGNYAKAQSDLALRKGELEEAEARLRAKARELGIEDLSGLKLNQPKAELLARVEKLKEEGRRILLEQASHAKNRAEAEESFKQNSEPGAPEGELADPAGIREKFEALRPVLNQIEPARKLAQSIAAEENALAEMRSRLLPKIEDLEAVSNLPLPQQETLQRFQAQFAKIETQLDRLKALILGNQEKIAEIENEIAEANAERPVPTREAIANLREYRDNHWKQMRTLLFAMPNVLTKETFIVSIADYERLCSKADQLADQAALDAERVAAHAQALKRLAEENRKLTSHKMEYAEYKSTQHSLEQNWLTLWAHAQIVPLPPLEMQSFLSRLSALFERRAALCKQRLELAGMEARIEQAFPELLELVSAVSITAMPQEDRLMLVSRLEKRLLQCEAEFKAIVGRQAILRDTQARLSRMEVEAARLDAQESAWRELWGQALAGLGARLEAGIEEAEALLAIWREVPSLCEKADNLQHRIDGMQRDIQSFESEANPLILRLMPSLEPLPKDRAIKLLHEAQEQAGKADTQKRETEKYLVKLRGQITGLEEERLALGAQLLQCAGTAQCEAGKLPELLLNLGLRDGLAAERQRKFEELARAADGRIEAELRAGLAAVETDSIAAELHALEDEILRCDALSNQFFSEQCKLKEQRERLEQGTGAELAWQLRRNAEAELREAARDWAVLKIAAHMIDQTLERHRAAHKDPFMARAGIIFATLTDDAWQGLEQEFDAQGRPRLAGRRYDGKIVGVDGMSEGTRDQLFLSLRLAFLEDYSIKAEAAPFIGDDLFTSFDETRTRLGLMALAWISEKIQPILFTHHRHVVSIAQECLGDSVQVIELDAA